MEVPSLHSEIVSDKKLLIFHNLILTGTCYFKLLSIELICFVVKKSMWISYPRLRLDSQSKNEMLFLL